MKPSEIRVELLGQHADIRSRIGEMRLLIQQCRAGESTRDELQAALTRLVGLFRKHNLREEQLLRDVLPGVDAWGPARAEIMLEQHTKEHDALYAALVDAGAQAGARDVDITRLLDRIVEHMDHEEKIFLAEDVLRDDDIVRDYFGG